MTLATERADKIGGEILRDASRESIARCEFLARFSHPPGKIHRPYLCDAMHPVHARVREWLRDAGMTVRIDAAGNIIGHRPGKSFTSKTLLLASHLDTSPNSGPFDGTLGVISAIAAVKLLADSHLHIGIDLVGFSGTDGEPFARPHIGSMAMSGTLDPHAALWQNAAGTSFDASLRAFGLHPEELSFAARKSDELAGYLELHLEQGPVLAERNAPLGVVTAVMGQTRIHLRLVGSSGHAGTTPMRTRKDALAASADAILVVETCAQEIEGLVATVGQLQCIPNGPDSISQEVRFIIDVRHEDNTARENSVECMLTTIQQIARDRGIGMELLSRTDSPAIHMNLDLTVKLIDAVRSASPEIPVRKMVSGEMHDAGIMAAVTPAAMLLLRTPEHSGNGPSETVNEADVEIGIRTLYEFLRSYAVG